MGNAVCPMGPAHGGEWEDLSCNVPQALHLVLGQSFLESELSRNKTKCHSPPIFLRKSSFVVVLNNSIQKFLSFFPLTLIQLNRKIPQHRQCLRTRSPERIEGQPFPPHHSHLIDLHGSKPSLFLQVTESWNILFMCHKEFLVSQRTMQASGKIRSHRGKKITGIASSSSGWAGRINMLQCCCLLRKRT